MPRVARVAVGGMIYHVINRANGRMPIFEKDTDYQHFESILEEGVELTGMRILAYCIMPNHWHLVLYPKHDGDMGEFMRWITTTHVRQRRTMTQTIGYGHLYQGTYKSFPVETNEHFLHLMRYVEQNPLRAKLVQQAEDWKWSSLWRREKGTAKEKKLLTELPIDLPKNYLSQVNASIDEDTLETVRRSVNKGTPFGSDSWVDTLVTKFNVGSLMRNPGRPKSKL